MPPAHPRSPAILSSTGCCPQAPGPSPASCAHRGEAGPCSLCPPDRENRVTPAPRLGSTTLSPAATFCLPGQSTLGRAPRCPSLGASLWASPLHRPCSSTPSSAPHPVHTCVFSVTRFTLGDYACRHLAPGCRVHWLTTAGHQFGSPAPPPPKQGTGSGAPCAPKPWAP